MSLPTVTPLENRSSILFMQQRSIVRRRPCRWGQASESVTRLDAVILYTTGHSFVALSWGGSGSGANHSMEMEDQKASKGGCVSRGCGVYWFRISEIF